MYGQQTRSTGQNPIANFSFLNLVRTEMRNKGLRAAAQQPLGVTQDLKNRTHTANPAAQDFVELHFCQLFRGPSETQNKVLILLPWAGSRAAVEGSLSLWLLFPPVRHPWNKGWNRLPRCCISCIAAEIGFTARGVTTVQTVASQIQ